MKAVRVHNPGGPEALVYEEVPEPTLEAGQALVKMEAIGVNFADVYARRGNPGAVPPINIGIEGSGTVTAIAPGVTEVAVGDRVAIGAGPVTYREVVAWPAARLVKLPDALTFKDAAASILQGMTAHYLACTTWPLQPGQTCLVHAAAGGVGLLLTQIAKMRGATVIGTVSTPAKAQAARAAGADEVIIYEDVDFEDSVKRITGGKGVDVVYDGVGATTFLKGIACLRPRGMMALFGRASGAPEPFNVGLLFSGGSLFLTQTTLGSYTQTREELLERAGDVFGWVASGKLKLTIHDEYTLSDASKAHAALEQRETIGKLLLIPLRTQAMLLLIDNYDSFTYNLYQYLCELGQEVEVFRNDKLTVEDVDQMAPERIVVSPGPCTPKEAGISVETIKRFAGKLPILGVCLGHQCIGEAYGATVTGAGEIKHGKMSQIRHDGKGVFEGLPNPFEAVRYHSLAIVPDTLPPELEATAWSESGVMMGVRHKQITLEGVQFHPESILTKPGKDLLANFLKMT